jgi:glycosyltransferase involved in cell wall biosynthesis
MRHLLICREFPPAPSGGIGTYALIMSRLLAEAGETVHVIGQLWEDAEKPLEEFCSGRLIVRRVPYENWKSLIKGKPHPALAKGLSRDLFNTALRAQSFSWQASLLAEKLVASEGIDIVEAQEYEAPLYYFQLRRALGLGPRLSPPCFIHLHSPSELIALHNGWDLDSGKVFTAKDLEDYSIMAADALLCPSQFLAKQLEAHYGKAAEKIGIIPYPIGENELLERDRNTWEKGTICYVGRLEPRKGVLEWIDAAVTTARDYPDVRFEFVGANALGFNRIVGEEALRRLIPQQLESQFLFYGAQKRSSLNSFLRKARVAVVPSRWDNFPYSCMEAMASGLPVIATREGGMAEMIRDGRSGWLAGAPTSADLCVALRKALSTPWADMFEMGRAAASDISMLCESKKILKAQLEFRHYLVNRGARSSLVLPATIPRFGSNTSRAISSKSPTEERIQAGIALIVDARKSGGLLRRCVRSIEKQSHKPSAVIILYDRLVSIQSGTALGRVRQLGWHTIFMGGHAFEAAPAWPDAIFKVDPEPIGFAFFSAIDKLRPEFIARSEAILQRCPGIGIVSCWTVRSGKTRIYSRPGILHPRRPDKIAPFMVMRTEVLQGTPDSWQRAQSSVEIYKLANSVLRAGWQAATIPEVLGEECGGIRRRMFGRQSPFLLTWRQRVYDTECWESAAYAVRHPAKTLAWIIRQLRWTISLSSKDEKVPPY